VNIKNTQIYMELLLYIDISVETVFISS